MWGSLHRHENASHLTAGFPLINLLLLSGLAACSATGTAQIGDNGGLGTPGGVMNVADAAIAGGDPEMALRVSQSVLATDPHNLDALYHEGAAYYAINRCMDAIAVYKVALTVNPASSNAELGIGRCELKQNAAQAELAFAAAVHDDPGNAKALNDLGIARDLQGNHAGAAGAYQQALLLDPGNVATEVNIGMSLALSGNGDEALQYLGPLATSPEATPKIREDYAAALVAAGRQTEARQVLAIDLTPDQVPPLLNDFSAAIASSQAAITQPAPAATASAAAQAAMPVVAPAPVVQTALATPPAASQQAANPPVIVPPPAPQAAIVTPPPAPQVAVVTPPPVLPAVTPPPAPTESAAAASPTLPDASAPPSAIAAAIAAASLPAAIPPAAAPAPQPIKTAAADPVPAPVAAPSPPPSAPAPQPVADVPAPAPPPSPAPPAPAKQTSGSWWNLLRAPTAAH
jgi:Flp pilus assembly protein TadD